VNIGGVCSFFIGKKEPKTLGEKNAFLKAKRPHPHFSPTPARSVLLMVFLSIEVWVLTMERLSDNFFCQKKSG